MSTITVKSKFMAVEWLYRSMILLSITGLGVSAYLMWGYSVPGAELVCGSSHGCEEVKNSVYANLLGIPLPVMGLVSYFTILVLLVLQNWFSFRELNRSAYMALAIFGISLMGVLYSIYLTYLELFVIYAVCRWCVASAIIMVGIFILSIPNLNRERI